MYGGTQPQISNDSINELTLDKIDFDWIKKQTKIKFLKKAIKLIEDDGDVYKELKQCVLDRIKEIDPKSLPPNFNNSLDANQKAELQQDINKWEQEQSLKEQLKQQKESKNIWSDDNQKKNDDDIELSQELRQKRAENERNKGNEALKAKDYKEAIQYYSKSIEYDSKMAASYCNRALVYLKLKEYQNAIKDCNIAVQISPDYMKAYHRRGKANLELNNYELAYNDFKYIMEKEPTNEEVNADLKQVSVLLNKQSGETGFKRVQIIEEDDENDQEEQKKAYDAKFKLIQEKKEQATELISKGSFDDAIKILEKCLSDYEKMGKFNNKDQQNFINTKATYLNNISLCYKQKDENPNVIKYINIIEADEQFIDKNVLVKAFLRRALSYEKLEKYTLALKDFKKTNQLDPGNSQAGQGIARVSKWAEEEQQEQAKRSQTKVKNITQLKDQGNALFKQGKYETAIQTYQQAIDSIQIDLQFMLMQKDKDLTTLYINLLTNKAQSELNLKNYDQVIKTTSEVFRYDEFNAKAYYRRGQAYKQLQQNAQVSNKNIEKMKIQLEYLEKAKADYQKVTIIEKNNPKIDQELAEVIKQQTILRLQVKDLEIQMEKKNKQDTAVHDQEKQQQQQQQQQQQSQEESKQPQTKKIKETVTNIDIDKLTENAVQKSLNELIVNYSNPQNVSSFEKNLDQFKKGQDMLFSYIKQIPLTQYNQLYSNKEIPPNYLLQIVNSMQNQGIQTDKELSLQILTSISKISKISLTVMFLSKSEKEKIKQVLDQLNAPDEIYKTFQIKR